MSLESPASPIDVTVLICTFNRASELHEALGYALAQDTGGRFSYEVLVVDNNSTDNTRQVVEQFIAAGHSHLRYLFEGRQGKSHALTTGVAAANGSIFAVSDDDVHVPADWLRTIVDTFRARPDVTFLGGKVLPLWETPPPPWLTSRHWSAIALSDYGPREFVVDSSKRICLLAGCFRTEVVRALGSYRVGLSVSKGQIGGIEDVDLFERLYDAGYKGLYVPQLAIGHKMPAARTGKAYHRRWHAGHGRFYAVMRAADVEVGSSRLFDVPAHLYRQAASDVWGWLASMLRGRFDDAFWHETRLRFFSGFFRERRRQFAGNGGRALADIGRFLRFLPSRGGADLGHAGKDAGRPQGQ
jgi:glycosyltransferase involved in cell wall biosynthesis